MPGGMNEAQPDRGAHRCVALEKLGQCEAPPAEFLADWTRVPNDRVEKTAEKYRRRRDDRRLVIQSAGDQRESGDRHISQENDQIPARRRPPRCQSVSEAPQTKASAVLR